MSKPGRDEEPVKRGVTDDESIGDPSTAADENAVRRPSSDQSEERAGRASGLDGGGRFGDDR